MAPVRQVLCRKVQSNLARRCARPSNLEGSGLEIEAVDEWDTVTSREPRQGIAFVDVGSADILVLLLLNFDLVSVR